MRINNKKNQLLKNWEATLLLNSFVLINYQWQD